MNYFENISSLEQLKKRYKEHALLHHPDRGGTAAEFIKIHAAYETLKC